MSKNQRGNYPVNKLELLKHSDDIRDYIREYYVYGYEDQFSALKTNGKRTTIFKMTRRIKSWMDGYIQRRDHDSQIIIAVDSRKITGNPLYNMYKVKSFTDKDIMLHFFILDVLKRKRQPDSNVKLCSFIGAAIDEASGTDDTVSINTIDGKLREMAHLGMISHNGVYSLHDKDIRGETWTEALKFFSESAPVGVIGSFLLDRQEEENTPSPFRFKHHYLLNAIDSELVLQLGKAIRDRQKLILTMATVAIDTVSNSNNTKPSRIVEMYPMYIYISTQTGRQYILGAVGDKQQPLFVRIPMILQIQEAGQYLTEDQFLRLRGICTDQTKYAWGIGAKAGTKTEHLEMTIHIGKDMYILERLNREKRHGSVIRINNDDWHFSIDVIDPLEMLPWVRTFTGRIVRFTCTKESVVRRYEDDLQTLMSIYGGNQNAV